MRFGILGGIGPEASSYLYSELIKRLRASGTIRRNTDYPHIIIDSLNAPELVSVEVTDEILEPYVHGIRELASHEPEFIVMACNTVHLFRDRLINASGYANLSDMSKIVAAKLSEMPGSISVIGTLAAVSSGLYRIEGRTYLDPSEDQLKMIDRVVLDFNVTGEVTNNKQQLLNVIEDRRRAGAEIFIAGCTEISELLHGVEHVLILDTLELLIEDTLVKIKSSKK